MSKLLTTTIVASKWACGGRETQLVNKDGTMCCLGFDGTQRGISAELMKYRGLPAAFRFDKNTRATKYVKDWTKPARQETLEALPPKFRKASYELQDLAVDINDTPKRMTKRERVELLRPVFNAAGRRIRFIDDEQRKRQRSTK